jgi:hypothetical protein
MTLTTNYTPSIDPRDIQTRKELINGIETTEDMQSPDTNGDPEGSENRANRVEFADFLLENHFASMQNTWGKPWGTVSVRDNKTGNYVKHNFDDGNPHLESTSLYIEEVMQASCRDYGNGLRTWNVQYGKIWRCELTFHFL